VTYFFKEKTRIDNWLVEKMFVRNYFDQNFLQNFLKNLSRNKKFFYSFLIEIVANLMLYIVQKTNIEILNFTTRKAFSRKKTQKKHVFRKSALILQVFTSDNLK
jgi:uncharacterized membrane protein YbaN (DUF454 family)